MAHKDCIALALALALTSATARSQSSLDWIDRQSAPQPSICRAGGTVFDSAGNVYASGGLGWFTGSTSDVRLVKYSPAGNIAWSRTYGVAGANDWSIALAIGANGLIHELSSSGLSSNVQARISTWDPAGNLAWTALLPTGCEVSGMVVGAQGELLCHGLQGLDAWIGVVSAGGQAIWSRTISGITYAYDVANDAGQDAVGNWYVALQLDVPSLGSLQGSAGIAKFSSSGQHLWQRQYHALGSGFQDIGVAADGTSVAAGHIKVGGGEFLMLISGHDAAGTWLWEHKPYSPGKLDRSEDVTVGADGIAWVAGIQALQFDSLAVFRFSKSGQILSIAHVPGDITGYPRDAQLRLGSAGQAYVVSTINNSGTVWTAQLDAAGALTWVQPNPAVPTTPPWWVGDIDVSPDGHLAIVVAEGPNQNQTVTTLQLDLTELPQAYCAGKLHSLGCVPSMTFLGESSAASSYGFVLRVIDALPQHAFLLAYGTSGAATTPFQGGTLCIQPPIRRTPVYLTGGNMGCSGLGTVDMNRFASGLLGGTPSQALSIPGTAVFCQAWGRDAGFAPPNATMLSNALRYVVLP